MQSKQIEHLVQDNKMLTEQLLRVERKLDYVVGILTEKFGNYIPVTENEYKFRIPDFEELKLKLDVKLFLNFALEFLLNDAEKSYENFQMNSEIDKEIKCRYGKKFNKQKRAMKTFLLFVDQVPSRPTDVSLMTKWRGDITKLIKDGMKNLKTFINEHNMKKTNKNMQISIDFLSKKENVEFINDNVSSFTVNNDVVTEELVHGNDPLMSDYV